MEAMRILDPKADKSMLNRARKEASALIPTLGKAPAVGSWAGFVDSTPDGVPVISEIRQIRVLFWPQALAAMVLASGRAPDI
jgi:glycine/D-amino acid oxidase-like deaminating enzyme